MTDESPSYRRLLQDHSSGVDRFEREILLAHVIDRDRAWIWSHLDDPIESGERLESYRHLIAQRSIGHPIAYLLGYREFYGRRFQVTPDVLIPRPETELLVELALDHLPEEGVCAIDIGTGSGAIGLTLAAERASWNVVASDRSDAALRVARLNRDQLGLEGVELVRSDLLTDVSERRFDLIASNPPYVAEGDPHLEAGDLRFEPGIALTSGPNGLDLIRPLIDQSRRALHPGGWLMLEHGYDQASAVRSLLGAAGFETIGSWTDLSGIERVSAGKKPV